MYVPADDVATEAEWRRLLDDSPYATLVAPGAGPVPVVLPAQYCLAPSAAAHDRAALAVVEAHFHRANPVWDAFAVNSTAVLSVTGPMVVIPHDWNARPGVTDDQGVPTSWYVSASCTCRARIVDDEAELALLLERLSARYEPRGLDHPVTPGAAPYGPMLRAIRGVHLELLEVVAKAKFGGNRPTDRRERIAGKLVDRDGPGDAAAAAWLRRVLDRPTSGDDDGAGRG